MTIYSAIQTVAKNKGVSIYRIEKDLDLTTGRISKWARHDPSAKALQRVADYLGVTSTYILDLSRLKKEGDQK
ncbi:helix-turn-helix transcriptional regulator [Schleiferilactobacillus perolens]|uniref:helix-turn-helix transcriptional regulator n=1 Tax=Schleiferilactobacillus perolens TaxID=100468 RepID=UPI00070CB02B|nr:helix-turn-helix transcriptional regulator [Schleiferilactobacillus perolens]